MSISCGEKIVAEAFAAFAEWCRRYDPDGNLSVEQQVKKYGEWCDKGNRIVLPPADRQTPPETQHQGTPKV
jgi:hypothetical protein